MSRHCAIAIVGTTATGKTDVGEAVAAAIAGEIVCADSRQVFRELDVGTGKPSEADRAARPHHLFEALSVGESASAGWYARKAAGVASGVFGRGVTPVFVGGSGLYLRSVMDGLAETPPHDELVRKGLLAELERVGPEALHERLRRVDPDTAGRLEPRDRQRIVRALEVAEATGRPLSWWHTQESTPPLAAEWLVVQLVLEPPEVRSRITARTSWMFDQGLIEETRALLDSPLADDLRSLRAIGYDEAAMLLEGTLTRSEAEERTNRRTAQLAKRQRTWFRHQVRGAEIDAADPRAAIARVLDAFEGMRA